MPPKTLIPDTDVSLATSYYQSLLRWGVGALLALVVSTGGYFLKGADTRLSALENERVPSAVQITQVEGKVDGLTREVRDLRTELQRMAEKIDALLLRGQQSPPPRP